MPDEVFELWIKPIIAVNDWPFKDPSAPLPDFWRPYFLNLTLQQIADIRWEMGQFPFNIGAFGPNAQKSLMQMYFLHGRGMKQGLQVSENSEARYRAALSYAEVEFKLPCPVVLLRHGPHFGIFDGHHRLAGVYGMAFSGLLDRRGFPVDAWIGEL